jgi:hypothetical protein
MPFQYKTDKIGTYVRWGDKGKKYYYDDRVKGSLQDAYDASYKQMQAISISKKFRKK